MASIRSVVDLPAPFGPSKPVILPSFAEKLTDSTAVTRFFACPETPTKVLCKSLASITVGVRLRPQIGRVVTTAPGNQGLIEQDFLFPKTATVLWACNLKVLVYVLDVG